MRRNISLRAVTTLFFLQAATLTYAQWADWRSAVNMMHLPAYLVAAMMIAVFVMIFYNRLYYYKEREVTRRGQQLNAQLALVLSSNKTQVWTYDTTKNIYKLMSSQGSNEAEYAPMDFSQFYHHDDFIALRKVIFSVRDGEMPSKTILVRGKSPKDENIPRRLYEINVAVLSRDKHDKPRILLGTQRDITEERQRQQKSQELSLRYHTVFNSSLVDMIFYNADGILTDINDKACETFGITDRKALLKRNIKITDIPSYEHLRQEDIDDIKISSITDIDEVKSKHEKIPELTTRGIFYYEATVNTIRSESGQLLGTITAGRNITEMVESHHQQQKDSQLLQKTTLDISDYINNINYSLKVSDVRLVNYYPDTHELEVSSDLNKAQYRLPQLRCVALVSEEDRRKAKGLMIRMDRRHPGIFSDTVHMLLRDIQHREVYLTFNLIPASDKDGHITHYFGMCRNDTEMVYTEMKLREETEKAQETEKLKNTFLLNMSYEIRTPLNAVLGFAELFNGPHDEEDEPVFAEEIKKNTGELLRLINDILFISRLDARMVEFNYKPNDFAILFDGFCYMGWSSLNPGVKVIVENPYSHLMVNIDDQNLGQVIQKLCANAAANTTEGTIRAKYEYRHGELTISIEDTGKGIDAKMLPRIFQRFARDEYNEPYGSGLDLPIVKELVEQMGGSIEIQSEKDKGTTAYLIIPCEMTSLEKKSEIVI